MQVSGKKVLLVFVILGLVTITSVLIGFRRIGWDRFQANTKLMEGKNNVITIARAMIVCADNSGHLPDTAKSVPPALADVGAKSFSASDGDWDDPAWKCANYTHRGEQHFRYTWLKKSETEGTVRAESDFDGNGTAEATYEQDVVCGMYSGAFRCRPGDYRDLATMR